MAASLYSFNFYRQTLETGGYSGERGWPEGFVAVFKSVTVICNDPLALILGGNIEIGGFDTDLVFTNPIGQVFIPPGVVGPFLFQSQLGFVYLGPDSDDSTVYFAVTNTTAGTVTVAIDGYILRAVPR